MFDPTAPILPQPPWHEANDALLAAARAAIEAGLPPPPLLLAYEGDRPLATVVLRAFGSGELTDVLVETLALLLPLGTDRVALAIGGRAWSTADPIPPVTGDADLRQPVLIVTTADAHGMPCQLTTAMFPCDGTTLQDPVTTDEPPQGASLAALAVLLDARDDLRVHGPDLRIAAQFARVMLLGHEVVLTPDTARRLELATTA